ncbi:phosphatidylinositol kinase- protein kinase tor1 [Phlyctochytrium planicorne]|nr:phosphatidylinositol kinase- protein kinase tor1 [Phlyctochytrium planicorne]
MNEKSQQIFAGLKNARTDQERQKYGQELSEHVVQVSREISGDRFTKFMNDINRRIFELINTENRISGIVAIDYLIDFDGEENTTKITRFANYLRIVLPGTDPQISVMAARALGRLALPGGTLTAEFVEFEVKRALEWLQGDRNEARRYSAVLVLREFSLSAPTLLYSYVPQIMDLIWVALRDQKVSIREAGAEALNACLELIQSRESQDKKGWYKRLFDEAERGLARISSAEGTHGSLLAIRELLAKSGTFMESKYREVSETIMRFKDHKDPLVRGTVISLCSSLAVFDPDTFVSLYLGSSMNHLLAQLKKDKDRSAERFLDMLSMILCGEPYRHPGAPNGAVSFLNVPFRDPQLYESRDAETIILALNSLGGSFSFQGFMLNELVRQCAVTYLDDDNAGIRKAAVSTCCHMLGRDPVCLQTSSNAIEIVGEILEKLLMVGITDSDVVIRQTVLSSLDERFDHHLAHPENIRALFIALNDEVFTIRELAVLIIGRLSIRNPAYVMPSLRKTLIQLLTELQYSAVSLQKEESSKLLGLLIGGAQRLVKPYVQPVLKVLLPKIKDASPGVAARVLTALGELSQVGCEDLLPYIDDIFPMIIETLQDQSSSTKREAALRTLGQLASNTGVVIEPYIKYTNLLNLLIGILKSEQSPVLRREAVKVIGTLGALDPYRHKLVSDPDPSGGARADLNSIPIGLSPSSEEYYPTVAINALMRILRDTSLSVHHTAVIQAIMPPFLNMMRSCPPGMLEFHFQQLGLLVSIVKQHIRNYLPEIFALIQDFWSPASNIQITILSLVEAIAMALDGEFKVYLPTLLPQMLHIFEADTSDKRQPTQKVLHAMLIFGSNLEEYLHLIIPFIVRLFEKLDVPMALRKQAIHVTGQLCSKITFADQSSRIIHPLVRILASGQAELRGAALDTLCALMYQMGEDFLVFVPMIGKALSRSQTANTKYDVLVGKLQRGEPLPKDSGDSEERADNLATDENLSETAAKKLPVNQQQLKKAWEASQRSTKDDWAEWIRRFSVELLKESPSHALRACASLASVYYPLARELFNAGFVSCWGELYDQFQDELVRSLEIALMSHYISPEILQTLLNLAEFMEHDDKALPIDIRLLGSYAAKCHAYAKALHYKELEFIAEPLPQTIEALISINNQLQQPDSAIGILTYAQQTQEVELISTWYEKLQRWEDGLAAYERKQAEDPHSVEATLGRMRCLHNLGEWEALSQLAQERWPYAKDEVKRAIAPLAAGAAWGLGQWGMMNDYINMMKADSPDSAFFRAILALHHNLYPQAAQFIEKTRELLDTELMALVGESYNRAYAVVVRIQMLVELEEIINYKQNFDVPERLALIRKTWMSRLKGCQRNVEVWQRILRVRALVISPKEDTEMWIKFANLCRKSGRLGLSYKTLASLLNTESRDLGVLDMLNNSPHVIYACLKHTWASGVRDHAFKQMRDFTKTLVERLGIVTLNDINSHVDQNKNDPTKLSLIKLLARCYLKLGEWQIALQEELNEVVIPEILRSYLAATHCDKHWYKAWHAWALANFEVLSHLEKENDNIPTQMLITHVVPSIQGFFQSIALSKGNSLQDTLRLLTLWFKYGYQQEVNVAIGEGFNSVTIDTWLQVIPQLIARIHEPYPQVRRLIHQLLSDIGKEHPQALVYSLTVASKSQSDSRKKAALAIMDKMRMHSATLVEQALLVSQELIRVAILWHEMWYEGLEEASRLYFNDQNVEGMFSTLEPLHQMLERGPETLREISFNQAFGRDLQEALDWCKKYKRTQNINDLNQAWDLYYHVFRRINKQLPQLTTLELQYVSPKLLAARDLDLAVPGTYRSGDPVIRITSFFPTLSVITSKQRPRRLTIRGSNGTEYQFLLKGHEDLRQDERVMQLFGLVNTLLGIDPETFKRHLNIERYSAIPLSPNSGLIGWVPNCDTLHSLIRDYRDSRKILLNIEHRLMLQMAPDYDNLTLLQKVEVFEYALENTTGQDLYKVLWLKSKNSEVWLDRRTTYTRSLAVMSMVGYILGLGDRHPSNLMLDRFTGKVVHIDFGDCFEVAMHREKFPEKIPFRLTRMLINAMEVSGIEGNYRITCEHVMRVLRENKDSLMAVLEAFVYDPLINWRLLTNPSPKIEGKPNQKPNSNNKIENDMLEDTSHKFPASRKQRTNENELITGDDDEHVNKPEGLNARALSVINRVSSKLTGRDFKTANPLDVSSQVQKLILQATSLENLCQCYIGWCAFW